MTEVGNRQSAVGSGPRGPVAPAQAGAQGPRQPPFASSQRLAVVAAARAWLGTPWRHAADVRGHGVDCAMLLVRVYVDLGLVPPFDPRPYTRDWFLHRDEERFLGHLLARAAPIAAPQPGDVMLFKLGRCFAHGAIVSRADPLTIIHAFAPAGCVVEDQIRAHPQLGDKPARFFSFWGNSAC